MSTLPCPGGIKRAYPDKLICLNAMIPWHLKMSWALGLKVIKTLGLM